MQLNPSEISELLKGRIKNLGVSTELRTQGSVVTVTDGICRIHRSCGRPIKIIYNGITLLFV